MKIENSGANIETSWLNHKDKAIKTVLVDGKKIDITQFSELEDATLTENGTYRGTFKKVTVDVKPLEEQNIRVTKNGTYYPAPGKTIGKVDVNVFDADFAKEDLIWSEIL